MSCFQRERDLSEGKIGESSGIGSCRVINESFSAVDEGNMASKCAWVTANSSGTEESLSKSIKGCSIGACHQLGCERNVERTKLTKGCAGI